MCIVTTIRAQWLSLLSSPLLVLLVYVKQYTALSSFFPKPDFRVRAHTPYSLIILECLVNLWDVYNFGACQDRSKSSQIQWSWGSTDPSVFTASTCYNRGQEPAEGGVGVVLGQQVLPFLGQVDFFLSFLLLHFFHPLRNSSATPAQPDDFSVHPTGIPTYICHLQCIICRAAGSSEHSKSFIKYLLSQALFKDTATNKSYFCLQGIYILVRGTRAINTASKILSF